MERLIRRWLCAVLLCAAGPLPAQPADVIDRGRLAKLASKEPQRLFDDPQLACYLEGLLAREELEALKKRMQNISTGETPDAAGAFVFTGGVTGLYTLMEGIVVVHPEGRLWVAYIEGKKVKYFAHGAGSSAQPPRPIETWRDRFKEKALTPSSSAKNVSPEALGARCSRQKLSAELERFNRALSRELCERGAVEFSPFQPAVVKGTAPGGRVYFFSEPVSCPGTAACPSQMKAYLVENDAVELASGPIRKEGFLCAAYQGAKGRRTVGWLLESALSQRPMDLPASSGTRGSKLADWVGKWSQPSASIVIQAAGPARIQARGEASKGAHTGDFEQAYSLSGPIAQLPAGAEEGTCEVRLRLFNNALLAEDNTRCGGQGVSFRGLYYR